MTIYLRKVLVGSRAHGLERPDSDEDWRGVFVTPTEELLKVGVPKPKDTIWIEDNKDDTSWEVGKFLQMALNCNPTILEVFAEDSELGPCTDRWVYQPGSFEDRPLRSPRLADIFQYVWTPEKVATAFRGYAHNQRKKYIEAEGKRNNKFAVAWIRSLYQAITLIQTEAIYLRPTAYERLTLERIRDGVDSPSEVLERGEALEAELMRVTEKAPHREQDIDAVNYYLMTIRKEFWSG